MASAVKPEIDSAQSDEELALIYACDLVYKGLLELGKPAKVSDIVKAIGRPEVDVRLTRVALTSNPKITARDRKWTLWTRLGSPGSSVDQSVWQILEAANQPIRQHELAQELTAIYGRPPEVYIEILDRLVASGQRYFRAGGEYIAPASWLLNTEPGDPDEVLFENFISDEELQPFEAVAAEADAAPLTPESIQRFLDLADGPVPLRVLQFFAWKAQPEQFDAKQFFTMAFLDSGAVLLSTGEWAGHRVVERLESHFPALAEREVSDNAEAEAQEAAQPLTLGDEERGMLIEAVLDSEGSARAGALLGELFDVSPDDRTYEDDLRTVSEALSSDSRVVWVGADRFRPHGTIPQYIYSVPALLETSARQYLDAEGNPVDLLIEDEGFNGGLEREVLNPLAQDVLDEEPVPLPDPNPPSNARAVVKYHHKQIGTLPMCQFPAGFFPAEPAILETTFVLPGGQNVQVWANNDTRLLYGLIDWFQSIPIDSGATFTLERQAPDLYVVNYNDESEPSMFISRNRINELLEIQARAEAQEISTFDLMREIVEHYRKGIEFLTLLTEVNIVRRTRRRLVASILSEYPCFSPRGGAWVFDAKKLAQGFDKSKRKYLVK